MAKKLDKATNGVKVTERDKIMKELGLYFANKYAQDIDRLKEGILLSTNDGDVIVKVILKKDEIEYGDDDVLEVYNPTETADNDGE